MDRGVKIVLASCLLGAGIAGAMLFRHPSPPALPPRPGTPDGLVLRQENDSQVAPPPAMDRLTARIGPATPTASRAHQSVPSRPDFSPTNPGEPPPPPALARSYPPLRERMIPPEDAFMGPDSPRTEGADASVRTHKIVDGDTLADLAERYLGDADRYLEIYEANRDLLPSPGVLPIGVEIRMPARGEAGPSSQNRPHEPGLVPVDPALPPRQHGSP